MPEPPPFTLGIEEEYLVVDAETMDLATVPDAMMDEAKARLHDQVSPEFRDCMIEVGTRVCPDIAAARAELTHLRGTLADIAARHGLSVLAIGCHAFGAPETQSTGHNPRYDKIAQDLGGLARRLMTCGMHVHVGLGDDDELRIDLMRQFAWFLPMVLALSASSPHWRGEDTELASWRLSVFDAIPRSRLPPDFDSWAAYRKTTSTLVSAGIIEDPTKIWWDMRPSHTWPTLEVRVADVTPRLEDALAVAAFIQSVLRMLWRMKENHMRWRIYDRSFIEENRWRAQRFGTDARLLDVAKGELRAVADMLEEVVDLAAGDAAVLGCAAELRRVLTIAAQGGSAARQRRLVAAAEAIGMDRPAAMRHLLRQLAAEFRAEPASAAA